MRKLLIPAVVLVAAVGGVAALRCRCCQPEAEKTVARAGDAPTARTPARDVPASDVPPTTPERAPAKGPEALPAGEAPTPAAPPVAPVPSPSELVPPPARRTFTIADDAAPAWRKLRPDAPEMPKGKLYERSEPKLEGWTPPATLDEIVKAYEWEDGPILDSLEIGRERAKETPPLCSVDEALKLRNDSDEANRKIASVMCQPPASDDEVDWDATMNRHAGSPATLNPLLNSSAYETYMNGLHAFGIFSFDHKMRPFADPEAITSWKRSKDGMVDIVTLRDDLTWEDGTPITADDIDFSYHVIMDPKVPVPAQRSGTEEMKYVKAYGKDTVVYFHKEPLATNVWNINFTVIPKHIYEHSLTEDPTMSASQWHAYWNRMPLSGNSYKIKEWKTGQHVIFERREDIAWAKSGPKKRTKPYFKTVRFKIIDDTNAALLAFKNGDLDEVILNARQWEKQTDDADFYNAGTKVRGPEWTYSQVIWNLKKPQFSDKRVRKALAYALDHDELLKKVYFGLYGPCTGPFNPDSPWGNKDAVPYKQDLDKAEELLDEAGWKDSNRDGVRDKDGVKFEFTMLVPLGGTGDKVAEVLKQNLKAIGIEMNIKMLEWATYQTKMHDHDFDAGVSAWGAGADPDTSKNVWKTESYASGRNYGGYSNKEVDELFEKGCREKKLEERMKIYQKINAQIYEDQPYLFLLYRSTFWAFGKDVRGYNFSPRGVFSYGPGFSAIWKAKKKS